MNNPTSTERYNHIAIALHWLIAVFIIGLVPIGLWMDDAPKAIQITVFQMHKSFGLMVLFLSFARLGWRLLNPPPALPATMKPWEKLAAHSTHLLFYALIIAIPLSGWMLVSASPKNVPTMFLTLFNWPHIWFLAQMGLEQKKAMAGGLHEVHELLAFGAIGLLVLHVGAALKHQFFNKDNEMVRMIPAMGNSTPPVKKPRGVLLVFGGTLSLFILLALVGALPGGAKPVAGAANGAALSPSGNWLVNPQASTLGYTFTHAGDELHGSFTRWTADIQFDPDKLPASYVSAQIELASSVTGDATYDNTLPEADWLDIAGAAQAVFKSRNITSDGTGGYVMVGDLQMRGVSLPITMAFTLAIDGDTARAQGSGTLDRLAYGIGANADGDAAFVSQMVQITLTIEATRAPAS